MEKRTRQSKISDLVQKVKIGTQLELSQKLQGLGIETTQSSLSRDLEELGIIKQNGRYVVPYRTTSSRGLLGLQTAGDVLIVAKCESGLASAVTVEIDRAGFDEIVGTIAGEDTIFIAVKETAAQKTVVKKIWALFNPTNNN